MLGYGTTAGVAYESAPVAFGQTRVPGLGGFYIHDVDRSGVLYIYGDSNGSGTIEAGEFAVRVVGDPGAFSPQEFTISSSGNLLFNSM